MGTRGVTLVIDENNQTRIAQYGQWDHYPEGQGITALNFLRNPENVDKLKNNLHRCVFVTEEQIAKLWEPFLNEDADVSFESANTFSYVYPSLSRDTGAGILEFVANADHDVPLVDESEFTSDFDFCEGIYMVNFARNTFSATFHGTKREFMLDELPNDKEFLESMGTEVYL